MIFKGFRYIPVRKLCYSRRFSVFPAPLLPPAEGRGGSRTHWALVCSVLPPDAYTRQELRAPPYARPDLAAWDSRVSLTLGSFCQAPCTEGRARASGSARPCRHHDIDKLTPTPEATWVLESNKHLRYWNLTNTNGHGPWVLLMGIGLRSCPLCLRTGTLPTPPEKPGLKNPKKNRKSMKHLVTFF